MNIVIATCTYPAAAQFASDWSSGVLAAAESIGAASEVLIVNDGLPEAGEVYGQHLVDVPMRTVNMPAGQAIASVRRRMVEEAARSKADVVIFCDADDVLDAGAPALHAAALEEHDVSVADLRPFRNGDDSEAPLFGAALPARIGPDDLAETNICGFSNTAVRPHALAVIAGAAWPDITTVDWWLFSALLKSGHWAVGSRAVAARYRQHGANVLGSGHAVDAETARRRLAMVAAFYRARGWEGDGARADAAEALADERRLIQILAADRSATPRPWHSDVARWLHAARAMDASTRTGTTVA